MGAQPNNKGNPVKQYEPYFSNTFEFEDEDELVQTGVTPIIHYDALDRVIRTELPNKTETRVVFDAWRQETWDPNDTVLETEWYSDRGSPLPTAGEPADPETRAAWLAARHAETPTVAHFDTLGRTFLVVAHNRTYGGGTATDAFYRTRSELDIEGNVLRIFDARQHATSAGSDDLNASPFATIAQRYDVLGRRLRTDSPDAGARLTIADVAGKPLRAWDNREQVFRAEYDVLQRQTHFYVAEGSIERLVTRTVYGEALDPTGPSTDPLTPSAAQADNLRGRVYQVYDSAGLVTSERFDFKGNLLDIQRRLTIDYQATPDWSAGASETQPGNIETAVSSLLETEVFSAQSEYDALNRVISQTAPDGSVTTPTYNEANLLEQLHIGVKGGASQRVIEDLNYNARGQRLECLQNNPSTEAANYQINYSYDPETFRVTRVFTERASDGILLQDLRYTYDPAGNITEIRDLANTTPVFSGTAPVDAHGRYEYDATYRLTQATGREHPGQQQPGPNDLASGSVPHPNDLQALVRYTERYTYDAVGNLERHQHLPEGGSPVPGWTRRYNYATDSNRLLGTSNPGDPEGTFSTQYSYNAHGSMTSMSHLQQIDWDYAERMSHANQGGGGDIYFTYDAAGERVRKVWVHTGLVEERIYLGNFELYRRRQGTTLQVERETLHVFDDQRRVAMVETKTTDTIAGGTGVSRWRFQLDNHLGTAVLEVDHEGSVISYEEYHPFGTTAFHTARGSAEVSAKRYRYTGKEKDELTQLYYHGARYYAPWLGRWTAADPAGLVDGVNLYSYVRNNPIGQTDSTGTQCDPEVSSCPPEEPLMSTSSELEQQQSSPALRQSDAIKEAFREGDVEVPEFDEERFRRELEEKLAVTDTSEFKVARDIAAAKRQQELEFEKELERERAIQEDLPGLEVAIIPVVGSGNESRVRFEHGDVVGGVVFGVLAVTDVFLIKSLVVGGGKAAAQGTAKATADAATGAADDVTRASAKEAGEASASVAAKEGGVADDAFAGVRELSETLRAAGLSRASRLEVINSFRQGTITARTATGDESLIRFFGGEAAEFGRFLTPNFPTGGSAGTVLALPPGNIATGLRVFQLAPGARFFQGTVAPNFGKPGGGVQVFLPNLGALR